MKKDLQPFKIEVIAEANVASFDRGDYQSAVIYAAAAGAVKVTSDEYVLFDIADGVAGEKYAVDLSGAKQTITTTNVSQVVIGDPEFPTDFKSQRFPKERFKPVALD